MEISDSVCCGKPICLVCNDGFDVRIIFLFVLSGDFYSVEPCEGYDVLEMSSVVLVVKWPFFLELGRFEMCWWLVMTCTHWHSGEFTPHHLCWLFHRYSHISYRKLVIFYAGFHKECYGMAC